MIDNKDIPLVIRQMIVVKPQTIHQHKRRIKKGLQSLKFVGEGRNDLLLDMLIVKNFFIIKKWGQDLLEQYKTSPKGL